MTFKQEIANGVRALPDEVLLELVKSHLRSTGHVTPTTSHTSDSHTVVTYQGERYLMWETHRGVHIQDEQSRRGKRRPRVKVTGRTESEARAKLSMAV